MNFLSMPLNSVWLIYTPYKTFFGLIIVKVNYKIIMLRSCNSTMTIILEYNYFMFFLRTRYKEKYEYK